MNNSPRVHAYQKRYCSSCKMKLFLYDEGNTLADRLIGAGNVDLSEMGDIESDRDYILDFTFSNMHDSFEEMGKGLITVRPTRTLDVTLTDETIITMRDTRIDELNKLLDQRELDLSDLGKALADMHGEVDRKTEMIDKLAEELKFSGSMIESYKVPYSAGHQIHISKLQSETRI